MNTWIEPLNRAIELLGGVSAAAETLGIKNYQTIQQWRRSGVPAEYCPAIERATKGQVRCEDLRPDVEWGYLRATNCSTVGDTPPDPAATILPLAERRAVDHQLRASDQPIKDAA